MEGGCWQNPQAADRNIMMLILVLNFFFDLLLLEECEDKRNLARSIMAHLMST